LKIDFNKVDGLVPAVVQDYESGRVLMLGYMNEPALTQTLESKRVTFFSRSKGRLWTKGESSGNFLDVVEIKNDCDNDALLILANPTGPTCHTGTRSCFGDESEPSVAFLADLVGVIKSRRKASPKDSYVAKLLAEGPAQPARKVGEEAVELVVEALGGSDERFVSEAADLLFHFLVLLESRNLPFSDVLAELARRSKK